MSAKTIFTAVTLVAGANAQRYPPAPEEVHAERFGAGIQRTMSLLATSTPAHRNPVRILFYGQSITKQEWSGLVAEDLRRRFPYADLTVENRAIGGYSAEYLIRTLPHDVYPFYPDLVIFHDFGSEEVYEQIIAGIRRHTTAEILVQSDYPTWSHVDGVPDDAARVKREEVHARHSFEWVPDLCGRHGCEVVDVRHPWIAYLETNHLKAGDVLADGVHLNPQGNYLLAEITKRHLRYDASLEPPKGLVRVWKVGEEAQWKDGRLTIGFEGNRVDLIAAKGDAYHASSAEVRIDGRSPSTFTELYAVTRPTDTFAVDWPAVNRVSAAKPLLVEDWRLRVLETAPDDSWWRFRVTGSQTGEDGEGTSSERFVSKSGRVVIEPTDWGVQRAFNLRHKLTPAGFEVKWRVLPAFFDTYSAPRIADPSREYATTVALGLPAGRHTLELRSVDATTPPLREIRIYRPPLP